MDFTTPPRIVRPVQHDSPLRWLVPSSSRAGESHLVELDAYSGNGRCSCPDFCCRMEPAVRADLKSGRPGAWTEKTRCKHIRLTRAYFLDRIIQEMAKAARSAGAAVLVFLAANAAAEPSEDFLNALAWAESRNNPAAEGDFDILGRPMARGAYQIHYAAWIDAQEASRADLGPWERSAHCPRLSRAAATIYLGLIEARLIKGGLRPTPARLWLAWSMGYAAAAKIGFDPAKSPAAKRRGLVRLTAALAGRPCVK